MNKDSELVKVIQNLSLAMLYEKEHIEVLHPVIRAKCELLIENMKKKDKPIWIQSTFRSAKKQAELYRQGRVLPGSIVTNANALESYHNYGLAFDAIFVAHNWNAPESWWKELGAEGKELGLEWGGDWLSFPDKAHFEWHPGFNWEDLKNRLTLIKDIDKAESWITKLLSLIGFKGRN